MFDSKKFIKELDEFELQNQYDITADEIQAIIKECGNDEDPLYLAVWNGFLCGCMKAGSATRTDEFDKITNIADVINL